MRKNLNRKRAICAFVAIAAVCAGCFTSCAPPADIAPDYADNASWAYFDTEAPEDTPVDVFFLTPTVFLGDDGSHNMSLSDNGAKDAFVGAMNMEKGIYDDHARFFAPYYRQAALNVYEMTPEERERYLQLAYGDVERAFDYYMENLNDGRPVILAGFSQGADMSLRLMKERFDNDAMREQLVACYAIGWSITEDEMEQHPALRFAQGEDDTGVIVSFNTEAPEVDDSVIVPRGTKTLAINPLSWKTDDAAASRTLNDGACFPQTDGSITEEIDEFTGAYLDDERGTLKVTDVEEAQYPPQLDIFDEGVYHVYDYQFFYRDLEQNVADRISAYREDTAA